MFDKEVNRQINNALWVLVSLQTSIFAIDSADVQAIFQLDQTITPTAEKACLGIIPFRDGILPLFDLRGFMGMTCLEAEEQLFDDMLDQRKNDHIKWVNELGRCLHTGDAFCLATDPHKCAFGKWYDNYQPTSQTVAYHLKQIDEPHRLLHGTAEAAFSFQEKGDKASMEDVLKKGKESYMQRVLELLDQTKQVFRNNNRRMVVAVSNGDATCGLVVDKVIAVEQLFEIVKNSQTGSASNDKAVSHVAQRQEGDELVLVTNLKKIFEQSASDQPRQSLT